LKTPAARFLRDPSLELLVHTVVYLLAYEKDITAPKELVKTKYGNALPTAWNSQAFCASLRLVFERITESDRLLWNVAIRYAGKKARS
jgi:hypothetical protein